MNYIYNGEIKCNKNDLEKVMPLVQNIFSHPDVEELNDDCQIVISDEIRGDITEEMDNFCQALEKNGLSVAGEISYTGDYKGRYILSGTEYTEFSAEQCVIRDAPIQDLIAELKRRNSLKEDDCHLKNFFEEIYREKQLAYTCEDAIQIASIEDIEIDEGDEEYLAKQLLDNYDCNVAENDQWIEILEDYKNEKQRKFYFTFGSDPGFPYQNTYLVIEAFNKSSAIRKFRKKFPDRHENVYNASFCYSQEEWEKQEFEKLYPDGPAEVIV